MYKALSYDSISRRCVVYFCGCIVMLVYVCIFLMHVCIFFFTYVGIAYILKLVDQYHAFDSLHWFESVRRKYDLDKV